MTAPPKVVVDVDVMLDLVPAIVWATTPDGELAYLNRSGRDYFGPEVDDSGHGWFASIDPLDRDRAREQWAGAMHQTDVWTSEFRFRRADGEYRWMDATARAARGPDGSLVAWVGTCADAEKARAADAALRRTAVDTGVLLAEARDSARRERHRLGKVAGQRLVMPLEEVVSELNALTTALRDLFANE